MRILKYQNLDSKFFKNSKEEKLPIVHKIIEEVKKFGDEAIKKYTKEYDNVLLNKFKVNPKEIDRAYFQTNHKTLKALNIAKSNIEKFSRAQLKQLKNFNIEIAPGVIVEQQVVPINRIGIYVPGGRFPLVSTVLMCGVPARVAGVKEMVLCSPPTYNKTIHPVILSAARLTDITEIYKIGGAQAIAALAYGTKNIKRVDKIIGPGNIYVTTAKKIVYGDVGIDFVAGPSEIMIIADDTAEPEIVSADLLSQAEHDVNAIPVLITDSPAFAKSVNNAIRKQLSKLSTKEIARKSLQKNGMIIVVKHIEQAIEIANKKAPEHLEIQIKNPERLIDKLKNYGSLFVGKYSAEVLGDYCSGINHTLPTNGSARYTGGLHIKDFLKLQTVLRVNKKGFENTSSIAEELARTEGLSAHLNSARARMRRSKQSHLTP